MLNLLINRIELNLLIKLMHITSIEDNDIDIGHILISLDSLLRIDKRMHREILRELIIFYST